MAKKTKAQELREELTWSFPHIAGDAPRRVEKTSGYCEGHKAFLDGSKTEHECVRAGIETLKEAGYRPFDRRASCEPGDRVYYISQGKTLTATAFGRKPLTEGVRISGAHIDSPRPDLKPSPLCEEEGIAYFKTHYYGGIRKYQWGTIPFAIHGVVVKKNGETVKVYIEEKESDLVFCITDLLPHLFAKQGKRPLKDELKGEELDIVVDSLPLQDEEIKEPFKLLALSLLDERYSITEKDSFRAGLELVPAVEARDVGLDTSMIGAYGQGNHVYTYTALTAEVGAKKSTHTTITIPTDKKETGSDDNTGLNSDYVLHHIENLIDQAGIRVRDILRNSLCLSSDINATYDPTFPDVYESRNSNCVNKDCISTKYTGARRESGSNDASAEVMAKVVSMIEQEGVYWQAGELGAVGAGGGETITKLVAHMNMDTVDLGVPVLSIHSPFELASKLNVYNTYRAFRTFYK